MNDSHIFFRRFVQFFTFLTVILIPILEVFRLDVPTRRFVLFGDKLWFQEVYMVIVTMLLLIFLMIGLIKILGRVPCGWMCPRNSLSELATKVLGKKGDPFFRRFLGFIFILLFSGGMGIVLASYFFDWRVILNDLITKQFTLPSAFAGFWMIYILWDILYIRHAFCDSACPYGLMQSVFSDDKTMRVTFDPTHCVHCEKCEKVCFLQVDPRTQALDTCVACGDCIEECKAIFKTKEAQPSLRFAFGDKPGIGWRELFLDKRFLVVVAYNLVMITIWTIGVVQHKPVDVAIVTAKSVQSWAVENGQGINRYQVIINNATPQDKNLVVEFEGIGKEYSDLIENSLYVRSGTDFQFDLSLKIPKGQFPEDTLVPFKVLLKNQTGGDVIATSEGYFYMPKI